MSLSARNGWLDKAGRVFIIFVDSVSYGAGLLVIAFLISPYGLPMLAGGLVAKLHVLRYMFRDWIYG